MTLQEVEDLARHVGGEALHHAVRHAHPFAVRARQADESACRRQRRERAQHLGLLAAHHVGLAGARFVEQAGHDPGLRLALTPVDALEALRDLRRRSEEHTSELQSLMRISYAVFCLKQTPSTEQYTSHIY